MFDVVAAAGEDEVFGEGDGFVDGEPVALLGRMVSSIYQKKNTFTRGGEGRGEFCDLRSIT